MPAGRLRSRFEIQTNNPVRDRAGQAIAHWTTLRRESFSMEPLDAAEGTRGAQVAPTINYRLKCRYFAGAHSGMRLVRAGQVLDVDGVVNEHQQSRWLVWTVREHR